jgi:hypothetical protein
LINASATGRCLFIAATERELVDKLNIYYRVSHHIEAIRITNSSEELAASILSIEAAKK